jgi:hypothetical protein
MSGSADWAPPRAADPNVFSSASACSICGDWLKARSGTDGAPGEEWRSVRA